MLNDPLLAGADSEPALMAVEHIETAGAPDAMALFVRRENRTVERREPFAPFLWLAREDLVDGPLRDGRLTVLTGDAPFRWQVAFPTWKELQKARAWLAKRTGVTAGNPNAPYFLVNDPVQQYLMQSGRTLFKGLRFDDLRRLQVDIECYTTEGFEFCNADREGDQIIAIALADQTGWREVLSGVESDERTLLERFVAIVRERDPDVIEGHNIFNFDLPYLQARARQHGIALALGRDGSVPATRPSRFSAGERTIAYTRFEVFGRHIVDTLFLVHSYDITHRSLDGFGLKEVARHFGLARPGREYIEGSQISAEFRKDPERVMRYAGDDVLETGALSRLLSQSAFTQVQMAPLSYQNVCVRGNAAKIDALILREYLRAGHAIPLPDKARPFSGGYTDLFVEGVVRNVHHCDVRSLYPSLMLTRKLGPRTDELGVFLRLLDRLRAFRLEARRQAKQAADAGGRAHFDALQTAFKVLINSFYGYLGFDQARFSDFDAAERVAAEGRRLLQTMIGWLNAHGARPVEIDTDGIYFVPPPFAREADAEAFRTGFSRTLPEGIEVEFDGVYAAMFSYKMKNYALLTAEGEIVVKGAALKSRGLEPFLRHFLREMVRLKLEGREDGLPALKAGFERAIREREWPVTRLAKTETLQDAPATYAGKIGEKARGRNAAYELALRSKRDYRAGDQVSYYVTGTKKSVPVHAAAKLVAEWNPVERDENVPYYVAKLDALYEKFCGGRLGGEEGE
jgi:DNA polymerase elongation subunit (family B)